TRSHRPVPRNYFPGSDVPEKPPGGGHGEACKAVFPLSHWTSATYFPGYAASDNRDTFPPEAYSRHDWPPGEAHPVLKDSGLCTHHNTPGLWQSPQTFLPG